MVAEATTAWAVRLGLLAKDAAGARSQEQYGWLAARALGALCIVADFMSWLFFEDDHNDETDAGHMLARMAEDHRRFVSILDGDTPRRADSPLCHALHDLVVRMARYTDRTWAHELRRNLVAYFDAIQWECRNRACGATPRLATYVAMRPFTSAVFPCFDLFAIADELRLPIPVYDNAIVQELRLRANNVVSYCNDIFSFPKEIEHRDMHNLVILIRAAHRCTLQEAVDRAVALHDAELSAFLSLKECVRSLGLVASAESSAMPAACRRGYGRTTTGPERQGAIGIERPRAASHDPTPGAACRTPAPQSADEPRRARWAPPDHRACSPTRRTG